MKTVFVILTFLTISAAFAVENTVGSVDTTAQSFDGHVCSDQQGNSFKLEVYRLASIVEFAGEDLYEGGTLHLAQDDTGFSSSKTIYQMMNGGELIISEKSFVGRGGGRGGFDDTFKTLISAKLTTNEKVYYFSCN